MSDEFTLSSAFNDDGTIADGFKDTFREEIGESNYFDSIKDVRSLVKSATGLASLKGRKVIPSEDAPDDEWDGFFGQLGVPEKPEDYGLAFETDDESDKKALEDGKVLEKLQARYKAAGVPKRIAKKLAEVSIKESLMDAKAARERRLAVISEADTKLKEKWGGKADQNSILSQNALTTFHPEAHEFFKELGLDKHPAVKALFYEIASRIVPGSVISSDTPGGKGQDQNSLAKHFGIV